MAIINKGDRKYLIIIHLGYDNGKRKTKSKRVDLSRLTQKQAGKEIILMEKAFEDEVKGYLNNNANMKFKDFVELWINDYAMQQLRPKTIASYQGELKRRITPEFGYMKINQIKPTHLITFYSKLSKKGARQDGSEGTLSSRTIKYQHQILSSILGQAVKWQVIKENPCKFVSPPKTESLQKKKNYFEDYEAIEFLQAIRGDKLKYICACELALLGGLRREEILGLDINDITVDGVIIRRTSKVVDGIGMVVEELTKNESSGRSITLPAPVIDNLKRLRSEQKVTQFKLQNLWQDIKIKDKYRILLFTQNKGKPMHGQTLSSWQKQFIKNYNEVKKENEMKLPSITFHGLRHTNASMMIYLGVDIKAGSVRMGHAQTSTFLNTYGHMLERADKEISNKLGKTLLGSK